MYCIYDICCFFHTLRRLIQIAARLFFKPLNTLLVQNFFGGTENFLKCPTSTVIAVIMPELHQPIASLNKDSSIVEISSSISRQHRTIVHVITWMRTAPVLETLVIFYDRKTLKYCIRQVSFVVPSS